MKLLIISTLSVLLNLFANNSIYTAYTSVEEIQETTLAESINRGEIIYKDFCVRCHMNNGEGNGKFYPPLADSDWLTSKRTESIHAVKYGLKGLITVNGIEYKKSMSSPGLEDHEIADVMNYIMNNWENTQGKIVTPEEVKSIIE